MPQPPSSSAIDFGKSAIAQLGQVAQQLAVEHARLIKEREQELNSIVVSLRRENRSLRARLSEVLPDSRDLPIPPGSPPCSKVQPTESEIRVSLTSALSQLKVLPLEDVFPDIGHTTLAIGSPVLPSSPVRNRDITVGSPVRTPAVSMIGSPVRRLSSASPAPSSKMSSPSRRAPSSKWSSPIRRNVSTGSVFFVSESFQLWDEWIRNHDESQPPMLDYYQQDDAENDASSSLAVAYHRSLSMETQVDSPQSQGSRLVMLPSSRPRLTWEMLGVPVLTYDLVLIPMQVFELPPSLVRDVVSWLTLLYWTCDLAATFFVGYYTHDGKLVMEPCKIMKNYLCSGFWLDLFVISIDWLLVVAGSLGSSSAFETMGIARIGKLLRVLRIVRVFRLLRLRKLRRILHDLQDRIDSEYLSVVLNIGKNLIFIVAASHFVACLWYWVGTLDVSGYSSWVASYGFEQQGGHWEYKYWTSLHWAVCQFTPGGMNVQPQNVPERAFSVGMLLCSMLVFSMFVGSLTNSMHTLQSLGNKNARQLWLLRKFFRQNSVSRDLSVRIMRYVSVVLFPQQEHVQHKDIGVLSLLSTPLRVELHTELHMPSLTIHPFFEWFSRRSLTVMRRLCCVAVKRVSLSRGDVLFGAGQKASEMYFPVVGELMYTPKREGYGQVPVSKGQWCCEAVLWCPWVHHGALRAKIESELVALDAFKFREVVTEHYIDMSYAQEYGIAFVQTMNDASKSADTTGCGHISDLSSDLLDADALKAVLAL